MRNMLGLTLEQSRVYFIAVVYEAKYARCKSLPAIFIVWMQIDYNCIGIGSSGGFGYRSQIEENDIALMDSMILAHWACHDAKPVKKQKISY